MMVERQSRERERVRERETQKFPKTKPFSVVRLKQMNKLETKITGA